MRILLRGRSFRLEFDDLDRPTVLTSADFENLIQPHLQAVVEGFEMLMSVIGVPRTPDRDVVFCVTDNLSLVATLDVLMRRHLNRRILFCNIYSLKDEQSEIHITAIRADQ